MRVGIYVGKIASPEVGGGATFQWTIINELIKRESKHTIEIYYHSKTNLASFFEHVESVRLSKINYGIGRLIEKPLSSLLSREMREKMLKLIVSISKINYKLSTNILSFNALTKRDNIDLIYYLIPQYESSDIPFICTVWDLGHRVYPSLPEYASPEFDNREKLYHTLIKATRIVIGNSEGKKQLHEYYNIPVDRVNTIPLPTPQYVYVTQPDNLILKSHNLKENEYLFYPAQFWAHKNHIRLLKAFKKLVDEGSKLKLALSGYDYGNLNYIKSKCIEYGVENNVVFLGFIYQEEIVALYLHAKALIFASLLGPDNLPPLEALALGCPVIVSDIPGHREQLKDTVLYFNPFDEDDIIKKIELLDDTLSLKKRISNGKILAEQYSVENYVQGMLDLIDNINQFRECWK